ncbi:MAG TPA: DUF4423 domain-containing protein [Polyangiaceae bacterium]|nr:DUF4423 domain-containing protein [Polyangiaceae bacterium]
MDTALLARELVRELRGRRTQKQLSQALGSQSNVLFAWESGRDAPSARRFFELCAAVAKPPETVIETFHRGRLEGPLTTREGVAAWLRSLVGNRSVGDLCAGLGRDRYAVGRWLRGQTDVPLPDLLAFIELTTLGLLDFLACLVDPQRLDSVAEAHRRLEAARRSAREVPWSHAIVHMVELPSYRRLTAHEPGWFASRLGITTAEERRCLDLLVDMGRLRKEQGRYLGTDALHVDTRSDPDATRRLAAFWMKLGAERVESGGSGRFAFNTFAVGHAELGRLRELQGRYFAELRSIVAECQVAEVVAVATFQLFALASEPE